MNLFKTVLTIILAFHKISQSQGWFTVTSPQPAQIYTKKQLHTLKRPVYTKAVAYYHSPKAHFPTALTFIPSPVLKYSSPSHHITSGVSFTPEQTQFQSTFEPATSDFSSEFLFDVDFTKPKTQTFYKATLLSTKTPVYEFRYKIHDPKEENYQEKSETRVGDSVRGYYSVKEPNGYVRLVKYKSDENGFQTQVSHHHVENEEKNLFKHAVL